MNNELYSEKTLATILSLLKDKLPEYLKQCQEHPKDVHQYAKPSELFHLTDFYLKNPSLDISKRIEEILKELFLYSRPIQSPHYIGHQVAAPIPWAGALEAATGVLNQGAAVFEMGPYVLAAERSMLQFLAKFISEEEAFEGIVTHGGTLANLTALLAARNTHYQNSFNQGITNAVGKPAIIASADAHYCLARALGVMGLGSDQVLKAPIDALTRKIDENKFKSFYHEKIQAGYDIFALVGSACSTPTGAIDNLEFLGQFCEQNNLWFHVDAAHGGGFLLSQELRPLFKGIERADSIVWDAHKMMFVPALCTFVFYKDKKHSYQTFSQDAPYLFDPSMSDLDFEGGLRTFECTKGSLIVPLFTLLSTIGAAGISDLLEKLVSETKGFHQLLNKAPDFEPLHVPEANILCFRYLPLGEKEENLDKIQDDVRISLMREGDFYITGTLLQSKRCLRVTVMNPLTAEKDFNQLLERIRSLYQVRSK
ncbi:MAG: pyridoxal phosphate-dependent decarboxylase family protein [Bacteriovoracaceae bacterium]